MSWQQIKESIKKISWDTLTCSNCGSHGAKHYPCRTQYDTSLLKEFDNDPNYIPLLCPECAREYNEYWDEMWREYYNGRF